MTVEDTFSVGPHAFRVSAAASPAAWFFLEYSLFNAHGWREKPRPGKPNSHGWKISPRRFCTAGAAMDYAQHLLRSQDREND